MFTKNLIKFEETVKVFDYNTFSQIILHAIYIFYKLQRTARIGPSSSNFSRKLSSILYSKAAMINSHEFKLFFYRKQPCIIIVHSSQFYRVYYLQKREKEKKFDILLEQLP